MSQPTNKRRSSNLNVMTIQAVNKILQSTGHALVVDDIEHINRLDAQAWRIARPDDQAELDIAGLPVVCGNAMMRSPSLGKLRWFEDARAWFASDPIMVDIALGYICATDNTENALSEICTREAAEAALTKWWRRLSATPDQYYRALFAVVPQTDSDAAGRAEYGPTIALLCREYGGTPSYWLWDASVSLCRTMLDDYTHRQEAEYKAATRSKRAGGRGTAAMPPPPPTPRLRHLKRFRLMKNALVKRWQT